MKYQVSKILIHILLVLIAAGYLRVLLMPGFSYKNKDNAAFCLLALVVGYFLGRITATRR